MITVNSFSADHVVSGANLLEAVKNTYDNARLLVYYDVVNKKDHRLIGLAPKLLAKSTVLQLIRKENAEEYKAAACGDVWLIRCGDQLLDVGQIEDNQKCGTPLEIHDAFHLVKANNAYVYFHVNHATQTITFALGDLVREVPLKKHRYLFYPRREYLYCNSSESLEDLFKDPFYARSAIQIGRNYLGFRAIEIRKQPEGGKQIGA